LFGEETFDFGGHSGRYRGEYRPKGIWLMVRDGVIVRRGFYANVL
jgi:hypothetical protein